MLISGRYTIFYNFCNVHHNIKITLATKKASVANVQTYAANDPNRIVIFAKDIMNISGRKKRAARKLLAKIKKKYKKGRGDFISVDEFCDFTSLKKESVREFLST